MLKIHLAAVVAALVFTASALGQNLYRWRDAQGQWHFADAPPSGQPAEAIAVTPEPVSERVLSVEEHHARWAKVLADPAAEAETRQRVRKKAAARRAETRERAAQARRCERYERDLDKLDSRMRAGYSGQRGSRLSERRRELREAQWKECR
ncbi:MAG: DUF4124 domain-containing protein [Gammaproteobacteria bacterium]|nr:DUF4124 domain-containing protein [Gammaproteobacteria bacterium]